MANDWDYDDDDNTDSSGRGNDNDSSALRSLRKAEKEKSKALAEALEKLAAVEARERDRTIKDAFTAKGLNPKIAGLVPKDIAADAIDQWVTDYADVFGVTPPAPSQDNPEGSNPVDNGLVDAMSRIGEATGSIQPNNGSPQNLEARILAAQTLEELNMIVHGNKDGMTAF